MKRYMVLLLMLSLLLTGCGTWRDGEYHSVRLHASDGNKLAEDMVTVSDYNSLRDALVDMVTTGREQSTFYVDDFSLDTVGHFMDTAILHVQKNCPVGAYAVDEITYESGTSGGMAAIAVDVSYIHGRQEILRIKNVPNTDSAQTVITTALRSCESSVVVKIKEYTPLDVELVVQEYVNDNPHLCMELPQVTSTTYPEQGDERVLEVFFTYQTSRDQLRNMQSIVTPIFNAAELYVRGSEGEAQKYEQLYAFLMERNDYTVETSITPVYSLLQYGVGDSKAFAMVYNIMCQNAKLPCQVVSGTKDGEAYYWNLIQIEGSGYHVDLLASSRAGEFVLMRPDAMTGYVWDYDSYE